MKPAGKVALVGLGIAAVAALPVFLMTGQIGFARKMTPQEREETEKRLEAMRRESERAIAEGRVAPAPDGSGRMAPVVGPAPVRAGNARGYYG